MSKEINKRLSALGISDKKYKECVEQNIVEIDEYRTLKKGDIIRGDDECYNEALQSWSKLSTYSNVADHVGKKIGDNNKHYDVLFRRKEKIKKTVNKKTEIRCEIISGVWNGQRGVIINTVDNGAFMVKLDNWSINLAFYGSEIKGV